MEMKENFKLNPRLNFLCIGLNWINATQSAQFTETNFNAARALTATVKQRERNVFLESFNEEMKFFIGGKISVEFPPKWRAEGFEYLMSLSNYTLLCLFVVTTATRQAAAVDYFTKSNLFLRRMLHTSLSVSSSPMLADSREAFSSSSIYKFCVASVDRRQPENPPNMPHK